MTQINKTGLEEALRRIEEAAMALHFISQAADVQLEPFLSGSMYGLSSTILEQKQIADEILWPKNKKEHSKTS